MSSPPPPLPPHCKGGQPRTTMGIPLQKHKSEGELSQNPLSVKRRRRLRGQDDVDREVERAGQRDRANRKKAIDRYMATEEYNALDDAEKEAARKKFKDEWNRIK